MRTAALLALIVPLALAPLSARAGDPLAEAKAKFQEGAQAYREARYKDAIDLFLQANQLEPNPELIFNVGQAYEKSGDVPNALRSYRDYLRRKPGASDRATVEASIKNLEQRLRDKGVQQVSVFSTPAGAAVTLDGRPAGVTPWTGEIPPGRHVIVLKASGFSDTAKEFALTGDRAMDLDIALSAAGAGSAATPVGPPPPPASAGPPAKDTAAPHGGGVKPLTLGVLGVGIAGLGAALGLELARESAQSAAGGDPTQVGFQSSYDAMQSRQTAARVFLGAGAAVTVAGGVLLLLDLRSGRQEAAPRAGAFCTGGGCGVFASGNF
jgi:tetratricopeptide (TPR) repeat protein